MAATKAIPVLAIFAALAPADDSQRLLRVDHYVSVRSTAPGMTGQAARIYVREVVRAGAALRGKLPVVLFIHGAGTPAEVAFDVPYSTYSWMAFLARAGYDVFAMDMTGYGRSTRPHAMNDPCNLSPEQQTQFLKTPCPAPDQRITSVESDWDDIGAVADYLRSIRGDGKLNLVGWSLGGPRAGGWTARNPDRVARILLLAPAYFTANPRNAGAALTRQPPMNTQSRADFDANWDRQLGCPDQFDMAARESVWSEMLASDPVGATWGSGVRRAPNAGAGVSGWNREVVAKMKTPAAFVAAVHDQQAPSERIRTLHTDYGGAEKIFLDLGCASHNALWERNHLVLFRASLEWFDKGTINGIKAGEARLP